MTYCRNYLLFCQYLATSRAVTSLCLSVCCTGWSYCRIFYFCMTCRLDYFLLFKYFSTNRAMTSLCQSIFLTCCRYCCIFNFFMSKGFDVFCLRCFTACTCICFHSSNFTRCFFCYFSFIPGMSCCWNILIFTISTYITYQLFFSRLCACSIL